MIVTPQTNKYHVQNNAAFVVEGHSPGADLEDVSRVLAPCDHATDYTSVLTGDSEPRSVAIARSESPCNRNTDRTLVLDNGTVQMDWRG